MEDKLYTKKYTISVEGETEKLYFDWLGKQINAAKGGLLTPLLMPRCSRVLGSSIKG